MIERDIFIAALQKADLPQRQAYLDEACAGQPELRRQVERLLAIYEGAGSFLEKPAAESAATGAFPVAGEQASPCEVPGAIIGPYKLIEQIGEGGMGTVWMAQQTEPVKRVVALKLIKAGMDSKQVIARFEAERQALALMDHPNIARVLDAGTTSAGRPYFVMDLVKGVPITRYCDEHRLTPRQRLELFVPVCLAVQHAHQKGIIHRDLKPSNVLVAIYDGKPVPRVIDFGVAKAAGQALTEKTLVTGFGAIVGTLEYMSPEQAEVNQLDIDTRSDIYSLGVLLYELLAGSPPFTKKDLEQAGMLEMLRVIREQEPSKPSTKLSSSDALPSLSANRGTEPAKLTKLVRGELDWIVMKALEKDRNRRYETANGFAMDVQRYLADEPVQAGPPSVAYRLRKFARRNKGGLAAAALVLLFLVLLGSSVGWVVRDRAAREAEFAQERANRDADLKREREARRTKVAGQVEAILLEVDRLEGEQKWTEALAAVRRAEAAVSGGEADNVTAVRVRARVKALELIERLEHLRVKSSDDAERDYAQAFREYGTDVDDLPVGAAIQRLKALPTLAIPLSAALDAWGFLRRNGLRTTTDTAGWKRLVAIARGIDPDPLRDQLRSAWDRPLAEVQDQLRSLADSIHVQAQHPATLSILARTLEQARLEQAAMRIRRAAQLAYPGDFWLNDSLGYALHKQRDLDGVIRFWTVTAALRPTEGMGRYPWIAQYLHERGELDEAIAVYRQLIESEPEEAGHYWSSIGDILRDQQKPAEAAEAYGSAIAAYRQAIQAWPKSAANSAHYLGNLLRAQGRPDEALAAYQQGIDADPKLAGAFYGLIRDTLIAQGKPDAAIAAYRKAIEAEPSQAGTYWREIGNILRDQQRPAEAADAYRKAIAA